MFKKLKNKKGFTLVELIVVLVILAILAALLVPALTGYIDKANNEKVVATTRQVVMAAQTEVSEAYGKATTGELTNQTTAISVIDKDAPAVDGITPVDIGILAEIVTKGGTAEKPTYTVKSDVKVATVKWNEKGHVTEVVVTQSGKTCTYTEGAAELYQVS